MPKKGDINRTILIVVSVLCGCDLSKDQPNNDQHTFLRSGMFSPMRTDDSPVAVRMSNNYLKIPANCFDSPISGEGSDDLGYTAEDGLLLALILPNMECRTLSNRAQFSITGEARPRVSVLISNAGAGVPAKIGHVRNFVFHTYQNASRGDVAMYNPGPLKLISSADGEEIYEIHQTESHGGPQLKAEIYREKSKFTFTKCILRNTINQISSCDMYFVHMNKYFKVNFGYAHVAMRRLIRDSIIRKFDNFVQPSVKGNSSAGA